MESERLLLIISVIVLCSFSAKQPGLSDKKATKETVSLFESLFELQNKGVIFLHGGMLTDLNSGRREHL